MNDESFDLDDLATEYPELGAVLESDALWAEVPGDLEDRIVAAIAAEPAPAAGPDPSVRATSEVGPRAARRWLAAVAAVALVAGGFGLATLLDDDPVDDGPAGDLFALEATDLAGPADGEVELTELRNGLRIILAVDDLPPAPVGTFYEAWMFRDQDQAVVSAGTFHMRNQTGRIELWAGVTAADYPDFVVTLEDDDGDATPSTRIVFQADVSASADS